MPHLLCIDDCPDLLRVLKLRLMADGYSVTMCLTATEALDQLINQTYDGVVTDFNMPQLTGLEFAKSARENGFKNPIILLTGNPNVGQHDTGNIDAIVMKGSHPIILLETLHHCLLQSREKAQYQPPCGEADS